MRKLLLSSLITVLSSSASVPVRADEGMWTLYNLPDAVYGQMQAEGYRLPKSSLYGGLSKCIVNFSGFCTGELVSPMGLVMTNHHCGFESIRSHSTVDHDYMIDGFYADSIGAELKNDGMFVAFMKEQRDVTSLLDSIGILAMSSEAQAAVIDSLSEVFTRQAKAIDSTCYVEIDPFYEGNAYYATTYQRYDDIRLVFAPPKSLGKFGGETDNWMWPRQTCDVSVFRIYVNPATGAPAAYSPDNVPMGCDSLSHATGNTPDYLPVSTRGYRDGDFAMTIGYPGSTERYLSSYGIEEMRNCIHDPMQQVRGKKQAVMKRHMDASEAVRIKYDSKYAKSSNYWKNAIGMNKCIDSIGIIDMKRDYERRIMQWLPSCPDSTLASLDMQRLSRLYAARARAVRAQTFFSESFGKRCQNELAIRAMQYHKGMSPANPEARESRQYVEFPDNSDSWDASLDVEALAVLMANYREQIGDDAFIPDFYKQVDSEFSGDCYAYACAISEKSLLMQKGARLPLKPDKKTLRDIGVAFGSSLVEMQDKIRWQLDSLTDGIKTQERLLCKAKVRMEQDMPHYSDANFTMRLSYGQVGGYRLGSYDSGYYTTAPSFIEKAKKADVIEEYFAQPVFHDLFSRTDFAEYADSVSQSLNLCFLTNNDITGGNSGSPVIDGDGNLIGLAFDGNWDSLSADIFFDATLARCICVDIRYILFLMKHWAHADRLLIELGVH